MEGMTYLFSKNLMASYITFNIRYVDLYVESNSSPQM
jgi:hypothetical protein